MVNKFHVGILFVVILVLFGCNLKVSNSSDQNMAHKKLDSSKSVSDYVDLDINHELLSINLIGSNYDTLLFTEYLEQYDEEVLFFLFSEYSCSVCVDEVVAKLNKVKNRTCVIGEFSNDYEQSRFGHFFIKSNKIDLFRSTVGISKIFHLPVILYFDSSHQNRKLIHIDKSDLSETYEFIDQLF